MEIQSLPGQGTYGGPETARTPTSPSAEGLADGAPALIRDAAGSGDEPNPAGDGAPSLRLNAYGASGRLVTPAARGGLSILA